MRRALIIMAKLPTAGQVKTRLVPPLNNEQAAQLYICFLSDTIELVRTVAGMVANLQPVIAYSPPQARTYFATMAPDFDLIEQVGPNLNHRLANALAAYLDTYDQVAAMSSDAPSIPAATIAQAFTQLADPDTEAVFGPCEDGGYYLVAMDQPRPQLIHGVTMSTPTVMRDTLSIATREKITVDLLPPWYDVDTVAALKRLRIHLDELPPSTAVHSRRFLSTLSDGANSARSDGAVDCSQDG